MKVLRRESSLFCWSWCEYDTMMGEVFVNVMVSSMVGDGHCKL